SPPNPHPTMTTRGRFDVCNTDLRKALLQRDYYVNEGGPGFGGDFGPGSRPAAPDAEHSRIRCSLRSAQSPADTHPLRPSYCGAPASRIRAREGLDQGDWFVSD